jgi:hypothetical protein
MNLMRAQIAANADRLFVSSLEQKFSTGPDGLDIAHAGIPYPTENLLWEFDAALGITKDGSDRVSQWDDQTASGYDLLQATGSKQPLWVDAVKNGYPIVRLDGSGDLMASAAISESPPVSVYFAVKTTTFNLNQQMWNTGTWQLYDSPSTPTLRLYHQGVSGYQAASRGNWHIVTVVINGSDSYYQVDDLTADEGTTGSAAYTSLKLGLGAYDADYLRIIAYNVAHDSTTREQVKDYLQSLYAI